MAYQDSTVVDRVIRSLGPVSIGREMSGDRAVDLSAALLARYARSRRVPDLLSAMEAALTALEADPRNPAAHFNAALVAREARLVATERSHLRAYLGVDSTTPWAGEARTRLAVAEARARPSGAPGFDAQAIRELVMSDWLASWADGILTGNVLRSDSAATRMRDAAHDLLGEGRDQTVAQLAAALPSKSTTSPALRALAMSATDFVAAQQAYADARYDSSHAAFSRVLRGRAPPVLHEWAALGVAASSLYLDGPAIARSSLERIVRKAPAFLPALGARGRWLLGTALLRDGHDSEAINSFASAQALFEACGEAGNAGATVYLQGEASLALGAFDESGAFLLQALQALDERPPSIWHHNTLLVLAKLSGAYGLHRTQVAIATEDVHAVASLSPVYRVEAALTRARIDVASYRSDARRADSLLRSLPPGPTRDWLAAQSTALHAADTMLPRSTRLALLDSAVTYFAGRSVTRWLPAVSSRAALRIESGRLADALVDLRAAHAALETERQRLTAEGSRIRLLNQVRRIYDQLAATMVVNGDTLGALRVVEEMRTSQADTSAVTAPLALGTGNSGELAVTLAMSGDSLLVWMRDHSRVDFWSWPVRRSELAKLLDDWRQSANEGDAASADQASILRRLYTLVIKPIAPRLGSARRITFGVAGVLATIPFAALRADDGSYLAEHWILSVSGRASLHPQGASRLEVDTPALFVAGEAGADGSTTDPLLLSEASAIRATFSSLVELRGPTARKPLVLSALQRARFVHFAGHATGDVRVPGDGFLMLGWASVGSYDQLTGDEISRLPLDRVALVVLAACESGSATIDAESEALPLARAFQLAGARMVLGTLWSVDDRATGALLSDFYAALALGDDPARALNSAQKKMLRHTNPSFRSPSAWAAFALDVSPRHITQ